MKTHHWYEYMDRQSVCTIQLPSWRINLWFAPLVWLPRTVLVGSYITKWNSLIGLAVNFIKTINNSPIECILRESCFLFDMKKRQFVIYNCSNSGVVCACLWHDNRVSWFDLETGDCLSIYSYQWLQYTESFHRIYRVSNEIASYWWCHTSVTPFARSAQ